MRLVYEALPPTGPAFTLALAALFTLAALIVAIGIVKLVDAISRAFFGTVSGAVGWIPFAGKVVKHNLHKIEQKISHMLGTAERKLDAGVALTWHNCAHLVAWMGAELEGLAKGSWHLAQQAKAFVRGREMHQSIRAGVKPVNAKAVNAAKAAHNAQVGATMVGSYIATGVMPRVKTAEWEIDHVLEPSIAGLRARTRALEHGGTRLWRWLRTHPKTVATGAFVGAVAFALTKLGGGWIRCANWRKIGKAVCRMPMSRIDALLGLLAAVFAFAHWDVLLRLSSHIFGEATNEVMNVLGLPDLPSERFTIGANDAEFGAPGRPTWPDGRFTIE